MLIRSLIALVLSALFPFLSAAQQTVSDTEKLNNLYKDFRYKEVIQQGEEILNRDQPYSVMEKCEIHRLLALSYYTLQDMQGALKNFSAILKLDPEYRLDPRENSPKILSFFEEIRHQLLLTGQAPKKQIEDTLAVQSTVTRSDSLDRESYQRMARSMILPGSGQIWRGDRTKGWLLLGGNIALLGATIYFSVETNHLEDKYLQETNSDKISAAYDDYNSAYKKRNLSLAGFLLLWLYAQVDFIFISPMTAQATAIRWHPSVDRRGQTKLTLVLTF